MKATIEIPEDLYRKVEAKSALEGRAVGEVTEALYRLYVEEERSGNRSQTRRPLPKAAGEKPPWFAIFGKHALGKHATARADDMETIRKSIALGLRRERDS